MKTWYRLNLSIDNAIKKDFIFPKISSGVNIHRYSSYQIFNEQWLKYMSSHGLNINLSYIFTRNNLQKDLSAHIDSTERGIPSTISLNWIYGLDDRDMVWYQTEGVDLEYHLTPANTRFYSVPISKLTEIDRCRIGNQLTLVNVATLHSIDPGPSNRICITARLAINPQTDWNEFINQHSNIIIPR